MAWFQLAPIQKADAIRWGSRSYVRTRIRTSLSVRKTDRKTCKTRVEQWNDEVSRHVHNGVRGKKIRNTALNNGISLKSLKVLPYLMIGMASRLLLSALALILLLASIVNGESDGIVQTFSSISAFQSTVIGSPSVWLIRFFDGSESSSDDNGSFVYEEVAAVLSGIVKVGVIDVSVPDQREIADALNLKSFPKVFVLGHDKMNPVEHKGKMEPQELLQSAVSAIGQTVETRARKRWVVQDEQQQQQSGAGGGSSKRRQQQANAGGTVVELTERNFQRKVLDNPDVGGVLGVGTASNFFRNGTKRPDFSKERRIWASSMPRWKMDLHLGIK